MYETGPSVDDCPRDNNDLQLAAIFFTLGRTNNLLSFIHTRLTRRRYGPASCSTISLSAQRARLLPSPNARGVPNGSIPYASGYMTARRHQRPNVKLIWVDAGYVNPSNPAHVWQQPEKRLPVLVLTLYNSSEGSSLRASLYSTILYTFTRIYIYICLTTFNSHSTHNFQQTP